MLTHIYLLDTYDQLGYSQILLFFLLVSLKLFDFALAGDFYYIFLFTNKIHPLLEVLLKYC